MRVHNCSCSCQMRCASLTLTCHFHMLLASDTLAGYRMASVSSNVNILWSASVAPITLV